MKQKLVMSLAALLVLLAVCAHRYEGPRPFSIRQAAGPSAADAWKAGEVVPPATLSAATLVQCFRAEPIGDDLLRRISGRSYRPNPHVRPSDLRYLRVLHYDGQGRILRGELICHKTIAADLLTIFRELYDHRYPIGRMQLIDDYDADDERSMRANNTTCFCYRTIASSARISKHALGLAVDINPLYNPYYRRYASGRVKIQPSTAAPYCDRTRAFPYKIDRTDLCYRLFVRHGFRWGGAWKTVKDYQHFEK